MILISCIYIVGGGKTQNLQQTSHTQGIEWLSLTFGHWLCLMSLNIAQLER